MVGPDSIKRADAGQLAAAAREIKRGKLVVFPTETVYGLGAHALDAKAVAAIFEAKGRPNDNPIIVHVGSIAAAKELARTWPPEAERLAKKFWPGPLTLVLPRNKVVPDAVTGGLDTVALRVPDHPVALDLLRLSGVPIAAPSANRSGRPSPTRIQDAYADLGSAAAVYLDGGPCRIGVESTVISLAGPRPTILRSGGISRVAIEKEIGPVADAPRTGKALAPGMKYRHYAPNAPLVVLDAIQIRQRWKELDEEGRRATQWIVSRELGMAGNNVTVVGGRADVDVWARRLFALLRDIDARNPKTIVVEQVPETGLGEAVMGRLRKAAAAAKDESP